MAPLEPTSPATGLPSLFFKVKEEGVTVVEASASENVASMTVSTGALEALLAGLTLLSVGGVVSSSPSVPSQAVSTTDENSISPRKKFLCPHFTFLFPCEYDDFLVHPGFLCHCGQCIPIDNQGMRGEGATGLVFTTVAESLISRELWMSLPPSPPNDDTDNGKYCKGKAKRWLISMSGAMVGELS